MKKLKNRIGMTMAELLMVVAIVVVLCGVAFIAVWNYQRSLGQLERDGFAKEIFIAAQNHLTAAYGEGYLGTSNFGTEDTVSKDDEGNDIEDDYYFVVNGNIDDNSVLGQMLPFGSIDETVRIGGSYIIRYQKNAGLVLDVFYCTRSSSPSQFNHIFFQTGEDYKTVIEYAGPDKKGDRKNYSYGAILGWYGGEEAASLAKTTLQAPTIKVYNKEKLYVEVTNPNNTNTDASLKLIITGVDSGAKKAYELTFPSADGRVSTTSNAKFTVVLDDVTTVGMHFADIKADTEITVTDPKVIAADPESAAGIKFIPGEDITIQAVAYSTKALANLAYSSKGTTNSLFGSVKSTTKSETKDKAYIGNIRHLENLHKSISNLDANDESNKIDIKDAEQTDSFSWTGFQKEIKKIESGTTDDSGYQAVTVYKFGESSAVSGTGHYIPIEPDYKLTYDGKNHSISDVAVNTTGAGGLFGAVSEVSKISNLELIDFSISAASAGALAGILEKCTVTNVIARNKDNSADSLAMKIVATTADAGGLIGKLTNGTAQYCAAAVRVQGTTNAGGLIGDASGPITGCYSGGHTANGSYKEWVETNGYDVTGVTAGGLVGTSSATINTSYSTCSVNGVTAGGLAGSASGNIAYCYATGYIYPVASTKYAFVASGSPTLSSDYYYRVINEVESTDPDAKEGETEPMLPVEGDALEIQAIDLNANTYNTFVGGWDDWDLARAFDPVLVQYYSGKYTLKTVRELKPIVDGQGYESVLPTGYTDWNQLYVMVHYGDWPSPEVFFINK